MIAVRAALTLGMVAALVWAIPCAAAKEPDVSALAKRAWHQVSTRKSEAARRYAKLAAAPTFKLRREQAGQVAGVSSFEFMGGTLSAESLRIYGQGHRLMQGGIPFQTVAQHPHPGWSLPTGIEIATVLAERDLSEMLGFGLAFGKLEGGWGSGGPNVAITLSPAQRVTEVKVNYGWLNMSP